MTDALPQPTKLSRPIEAFESEFGVVKIDRCGEPGWHFKTMVRRDTRLGPQGEDAPSPEAPTQTLALFNQEATPMDIEIYGHYLQREVDPSDWLDLWTENLGIEVVARRTIPGIGGADGDVVGTWESPEGPFAGRFAAMKWGRRLYLLAQRVPRTRYPDVAEQFFLAMAAFEPVKPDLDGLFAEEIHAVGGEYPVPWRVPVADSWVVKPDAIDETIWSYQATAAEQPMENQIDGQVSFGKLAFGVANRSKFATARAAAEIFVGAIRDNDVELDHEDFELEETVRAPFDKSWLLVTRGKLNYPPFRDFPCDVRCRVMMTDTLWFVSGTLGPAREAGSLSWMQNKRALDMMAQHINIGSVDPPSDETTKGGNG